MKFKKRIRKQKIMLTRKKTIKLQYVQYMLLDLNKLEFHIKIYLKNYFMILFILKE